MARLLLLGVLIAGEVCVQPAAVGESIPEPLTLAQALAYADEAGPGREIAESKSVLAGEQLQVAERSQALRVDLEGRVRWKSLQQQKSEALSDHQWVISARKPLYDFGRSALQQEIASTRLQQQQLGVTQQVEQQKLEIMERFFEVLLSDLRRTVADEAMTIAYLRYNKKLDRELTGDYSELDLLQGESLFQDARAAQKQAEMMQRLSRIQLAIAMNRPGELAATLIAPSTTPDQIMGSVGTLDKLQQALREHNHQLLQSAAEVTAARRAVALSRVEAGPELAAVVELQENSRVTSSKDYWSTSLQLEVPLYDGGIQTHRTRQAQQQLRSAEAAHEQLQRELTETLERHHLQLSVLVAQWQADQIAAEFREVELERNRALYEQEQQSNLGDALVGISRSHLRSAESRFQALLTRARLDQLTGKEIRIDGQK